jgi:hypothetical protein
LSKPEFRIEPAGEDDLPLLEKLMGDPSMTEELGGPESPEKMWGVRRFFVRDPNGPIWRSDGLRALPASAGFVRRSRCEMYGSDGLEPATSGVTVLSGEGQSASWRLWKI